MENTLENEFFLLKRIQDIQSDINLRDHFLGSYDSDNLYHFLENIAFPGDEVNGLSVDSFLHKLSAVTGCPKDSIKEIQVFLRTLAAEFSHRDTPYNQYLIKKDTELWQSLKSEYLATYNIEPSAIRLGELKELLGFNQSILSSKSEPSFTFDSDLPF